MAQDPLDRTKIYSYSQLFGTLGRLGFGFLIYTFVFPATQEFSHGMLNKDGYTALSMVVALGITLAIGACILGVRKEVPYLPNPRFKTAERLCPRRLYSELRTVFTNHSYRMLVSGLFCAVILLGLEMGFHVRALLGYGN